MFQVNPGTPTVSDTSFYSSQSLPKDPKALAGKFEAMIYRILLKESRDEEADLFLDSSAGKQIRQMQDDELAEQLGAMGQLGLKDLIADQIAAQQRGLLK